MLNRYSVSWGYPGKRKEKFFSNYTSASNFAQWASENLVYVRIHDYHLNKTFKVT